MRPANNNKCPHCRKKFDYLIKDGRANPEWIFHVETTHGIDHETYLDMIDQKWGIKCK